MRKYLVLFSAVVLFAMVGCQKDSDLLSVPLDSDVTEVVSDESLSGSDSLQLETRTACVTGQQRAIFNNVPAYANCPIGSHNTYGDSYVGGTYVGKKWQCVEYVQRYYRIVYGMNIKPAFGNANTFYTYNTHASVGLQKFANGSTAPQVGDILVSTSPSVGHVAIVTGVTATQVHIIDQNFSINSARTLTRTGNTVGTFGAGYAVAGLVRRIAPPATPTLLSPTQNATNLVAPLNFTWSAPNATESRIQIIEASRFQGFSASNGFTGVMAFNSNLGNTTSFTWTQPKKNTLYYWTVRSANSSGHTQFASYRTFRTKS